MTVLEAAAKVVQVARSLQQAHCEVLGIRFVSGQKNILGSVRISAADFRNFFKYQQVTEYPRIGQMAKTIDGVEVRCWTYSKRKDVCDSYTVQL